MLLLASLLGTSLLSKTGGMGAASISHMSYSTEQITSGYNAQINSYLSFNSLYGDEPDFFLINRFKTEKNFLQDTDAIVLFAAIARVRRIAVEHGTLINVRGLLSTRAN